MCPLRLLGSLLHLAVLPEHVEVTFRSPEILCLMHVGVTFSSQIPTVSPKTLCNPFRSGLRLLKYKSETARFTKSPCPCQGWLAMGWARPWSRNMHLGVLVFNYYYQLLHPARSFLHKSGNVRQAIQESPHRNGAVSIWKDTELSINEP